MTETYKATFHFPANNVGGPVQFTYTTTNGRGDQPATLTVQPGQTSAVYTFAWSGALPADNTAPGRGGVLVTSPNAYTSQLIAPTGPCIPAIASVPLKVTSVDMSLSLPTIKNTKCGTNITETYTATFHFPANNVGGTVHFTYTTTNGRGSEPATLAVQPGQTTRCLYVRLVWCLAR